MSESACNKAWRTIFVAHCAAGLLAAVVIKLATAKGAKAVTHDDAAALIACDM